MNIRYDVNCSILLTGIPVQQRAEFASAAGFDGVEFWWPFDTATPAERQVDEFIASVRDAGVALIGMNFFAGDMSAGDRGVVSDPHRQAEFREHVPIALEIGNRLGCRNFNALYGNRSPTLSPQHQDEVAAQNLVYAARLAADQGATVLLEAISGAPAYPLLTATDVVTLIHRLAQPNVAFLADLYHLAVNGVDVDDVIDTHLQFVGHVQIADAPGRGAPGTGSLPLTRYQKRLSDNGYRGWIGLEYESQDANPFSWLPREQRGATPSAPQPPGVSTWPRSLSSDSASWAGRWPSTFSRRGLR